MDTNITSWILKACVIASYLLAIINFFYPLNNKTLFIFSFIMLLFTVMDICNSRIEAMEKYNECVSKSSELKKILEKEIKDKVVSQIDTSICDTFIDNAKNNELSLKAFKDIKNKVMFVIFIILIVGLSVDYYSNIDNVWGTTITLISIGIYFSSLYFKNIINSNRERLESTKYLIEEGIINAKYVLEMNSIIKVHEEQINTISKQIQNGDQVINDTKDTINKANAEIHKNRMILEHTENLTKSISQQIQKNRDKNKLGNVLLKTRNNKKNVKKKNNRKK